MEQYQWSVGGSPEEVLAMLESLPEHERVHSYPVSEAIARLRMTISVRNRIIEEQAIHTGQGDNRIYRL